MPLEPLSESPQFLSGRFWQISIRKADLGPDLGNFYPDAGYGFFFPHQTPRMASPEFNFLSFTWFRESESCINIIHLRHYYSTISTI